MVVLSLMRLKNDHDQANEMETLTLIGPHGRPPINDPQLIRRLHAGDLLHERLRLTSHEKRTELERVA